MPLLRKDLVDGDEFKKYERYYSTPASSMDDAEVVLTGGPSHDALIEALKPIKEEFMPALQPHYTARRPEPIEVMESWFPDNLLRAFALKYIARAGLKGTNEDAIKDLKKAKSYIEREINALQGITSW
jgi:hypothetical protein